jgi:hypothetical protein
MMKLAAALIAGTTLLAAQDAGAAGAPTVLHISSHLPKTAKASLDGKPAVSVEGAGSTDVPAAAGHHVLKIVTSTGAAYTTPLNLTPSVLMRWHGKGYWCVNLLDHSMDIYSKDECEEEVTDAG